MVKRTMRQPTGAELAILRVLWDRGPSSVREVNGVIGKQRATGYTTTLKLMQIMTEKCLVVRDESRRTHIYRAKYRQETTQKRLVRDLLEKVFNGSTEKLVVRALSAKKVDADELARIRDVLDKLKGE